MSTNKQQGFSLLEILIAFSIMAVSLTILLRIFSGGADTAMAAEGYTVAVQIAESTLAKVGSEIPLKDYQGAGDQNKKYHWHLTVTPYSPSVESFDPKKIPAQLYKVQVVVEWGDEGSGEGTRQFQLTTLRLAAKNNVAS